MPSFDIFFNWKFFFTIIPMSLIQEVLFCQILFLYQFLALQCCFFCHTLTGFTTANDSGSSPEILIFVVWSISIFGLGGPWLSLQVFWNNYIPVPWKDDLTDVVLGLWSILSTAASVTRLSLSDEGQTNPLFWYCLPRELVISAEMLSILLYETDNPSLKNLSINPLFLVWQCIMMQMYSCAGMSLFFAWWLDAGACFLLFILSNTITWAIDMTLECTIRS